MRHTGDAAECTTNETPAPGLSPRRAIGFAMLGFRTLRHLTLRQLAYLPLRRIQMRVPARRPRVRGRVTTSRKVPDPMRLFSTADTDRINNANRVLAGDFRFVGHTLNLNEVDWIKGYCNPLWTYNLHYFDYAIDLALAYRSTGDERYVARFAALVTGWLESATPGRGVGWQPYPTALRVVNWVHALLLLRDRLDPLMAARMERSLVSQAKWLRRRLEYDIDANHLQKNYKALAVAGLYFDGPQARQWRSIGLDGSWRVALCHVLADGVHYERSPMYHAIALQDFLETMAWADAGGQGIPNLVSDRVARMVAALGVLSRPDGQLHLFHDTANGVGPSRAELSDLAARILGTRIPTASGHVRLPHAGYFGVIAPEQGVRLLIDAGDPGPRHQPGHAHCGILSLELDIRGAPFLVDSGVSGYAGDPLRAYFRSTRAHNTVMIDGREQSEIWGTFRMARRARVITASDRYENDKYSFEGSCTAYHCDAVHTRTIEWTRCLIRITDHLEGATGRCVSSYLHFHPDCMLHESSLGITVAHAGWGPSVLLRCFGMDRIAIARGGGDGRQGWYSPNLGSAVPAPVVVMTTEAYKGRRFGFSLRWDEPASVQISGTSTGT
jgi:uncharacterized heparinase superfamily protein